MAAAPVAKDPKIRKFDPRNARHSRLPTKPEISAIIETPVTINPSHQNGLDNARPGRSVRTILDSTRTTTLSGTAAIQRYFTTFSLRSCTDHPLFSVT